jgi:hypothetical protein
MPPYKRTLDERLKRWGAFNQSMMEDCYIDASGIAWDITPRNRKSEKIKTLSVYGLTEGKVSSGSTVSGGGGGSHGGNLEIMPLKSKSRESAVETAYSWALMRFYTLIVKRQSIRKTQSFNKWKYMN